MAANRDGLAGSVPDHRNLLRAGCRQCPSLVPQSGSNDAPAAERRRCSRLCSGAPRRTFLAPCTAIRGEHRKCWALQGLWAGSWFSDVAGFDRQTVVSYLFAMSLALSGGALCLGAIIQALKRVGIAPTLVLPGLVTLLILAELLLALRQFTPAMIPWCVIALMGAGTVVTYSITAGLFDQSTVGRVNGAINLFHIGGAFLVQASIGFIIARWPQADGGHYPPTAYTAALLILALAQALALSWYWAPLPFYSAPLQRQRHS